MVRTIGYIGILAVAVGAFWLGRQSNRLDDEKLVREVAEWRASVRGLRDFWRATWARADSSDARVAVLERQADSLRRSAALRERRASDHGRRADSLELAGNAAAACAERKLECEELRGTVADLRTAGDKDTATIRELRGQVADLRAGAAKDLEVIDSAGVVVEDLEKAAGGCRIPLLGLTCPVGVLDFNLTDRLLTVGPGIPFKLGRFNVTGTVSWRVLGGPPRSP